MSIVAAKWISSLILFIATIVVSTLPVIVLNYFLKKKKLKTLLPLPSMLPEPNSNLFNDHITPKTLLQQDDNIFINERRFSRSNSINSFSSVNSKKIHNKSAAILQIFMFFGGGVLLATCFCHLMPEVKENFEKYLKHKKASHTNTSHQIIHQKHDHHGHEHTHSHGIPYVELAVCCGFFLIFFLEEIVHTCLHKHENSFKAKKPKSGDSNIENQNITLNTSCSTIKSDQLLLKKKNLKPASVRFIQGLVTIGAFSAHSIFDGLAIGLQNTSNQVYTMLFAISMHKLVVAFAVGLEIFDQTSSLWMTAVNMSIFSIMSPIGIWIVIFSQSKDVPSENESLILIMLSAIATGTIIYIVFFEILKNDRSSSSVNGLLLWFIMVIGFVLMLVINISIGH